ncbi:UNVERIFIED_CONTAM: hypothetical protein PYX00_001030 [Menopon gallinae]|uniref:Uncharacterized protein n=1 Tax=Menopon gallinae TaxID=328185 RepID=A0AAW2IBC2_9NEOP
MKQIRSFHELNTIKFESPDSRQPTQIPKYSSATSSGDEEEDDDEEESGYEEMVSYRSCQVSDTTYRHREQTLKIRLPN